ncbi:porin [Salegentibacter salegens]|uniref:Phosphate-selective porin O and P n=1 Tax=Salegentibacter salegens TaxID=143223 RepID=A0A1M7KRE3_9FLAO|nr:porin [Salegentibacter salegens]PRX48836.1 phosphate-selective porin O/P [Salegentibacter salegens]SHM68009.1 Phosphate-selective porin O and P [Salegentibacter salegens]
MKIQHLLILSLLLFFSNTQAQDITENSFGNGIINTVARDSSFSLKFGARFQSLFVSEWRDSEFEGFESESSNILIRRARLKFSGFAYSPKLEYKLELGLSNRDISGASVFTNNAPRYVLDAVLKWNFYENFILWVGQAKLPGNRERVVSSGDLQFVDRSLLNSRFNIDRDLGVQLHHKINLGNQFVIKEIFAFSQGEGRNVVTGNLGGFQYTGRLEALPFGEFQDYREASLERYETPKLAMGVTYDYNNDAVKTRSNMGGYMFTENGFYSTDITTFFADFMFKYKGVSVLGEFAHRDAENPIAVEEDGTPTGAIVNVGNSINLQGGYLFDNNIEVVGRFTQVQEDILGSLFPNEKQYTFGISKYLSKHKLKVQTDLSFRDSPDPDWNNLMYRLQVDFHL